MLVPLVVGLCVERRHTTAQAGKDMKLSAGDNWEAFTRIRYKGLLRWGFK